MYTGDSSSLSVSMHELWPSWVESLTASLNWSWLSVDLQLNVLDNIISVYSNQSIVTKWTVQILHFLRHRRLAIVQQSSCLVVHRKKIVSLRLKESQMVVVKIAGGMWNVYPGMSVCLPCFLQCSLLLLLMVCQEPQEICILMILLPAVCLWTISNVFTYQDARRACYWSVFAWLCWERLSIRDSLVGLRCILCLLTTRTRAWSRLNASRMRMKVKFQRLASSHVGWCTEVDLSRAMCNGTHCGRDSFDSHEPDSYCCRLNTLHEHQATDRDFDTLGYHVNDVSFYSICALFLARPLQYSVVIKYSIQSVVI